MSTRWIVKVLVTSVVQVSLTRGQRGHVTVVTSTDLDGVKGQMRVRPILEIVIEVVIVLAPAAFQYRVRRYIVNEVFNISLAHSVLALLCLLTSTGLGGILSWTTNSFETITRTRTRGVSHA